MYSHTNGALHKSRGCHLHGLQCDRHTHLSPWVVQGTVFRVLPASARPESVGSALHEAHPPTQGSSKSSVKQDTAATGTRREGSLEKEAFALEPSE